MLLGNFCWRVFAACFLLLAFPCAEAALRQHRAFSTSCWAAHFLFAFLIDTAAKPIMPLQGCRPAKELVKAVNLLNIQNVSLPISKNVMFNIKKHLSKFIRLCHQCNNSFTLRPNALAFLSAFFLWTFFIIHTNKNILHKQSILFTLSYYLLLSSIHVSNLFLINIILKCITLNEKSIKRSIL